MLVERHRVHGDVAIYAHHPLCPRWIEQLVIVIEHCRRSAY